VEARVMILLLLVRSGISRLGNGTERRAQGAGEERDLYKSEPGRGLFFNIYKDVRREATGVRCEAQYSIPDAFLLVINKQLICAISDKKEPFN
jgi:hypothetical protein